MTTKYRSQYDPYKPDFENSNEYDMKERLAIDDAEHAERAKNYGMEAYSEPEPTPVRKQILEQGLSDENLGSKAIATRRAKPVDEKRIQDMYLEEFSPERLMNGLGNIDDNTEMTDEAGNVIKGKKEYYDYFNNQFDEKRRQVESGEIDPQEIRRFLRVRNRLGLE